MLCLRCGGCCLHLDIFIVNPSSIREDGSIDPDDRDCMIHKPSGVRCPHLSIEMIERRDEGKQATGAEGTAEAIAVCMIHDLPCYQESPCHQFEQIGPEESVCIMNGYFNSLGLLPVANKKKKI